MTPKLYYIARSTNAKTGDIPQQFIGGTLEETRQTCKGCPLLTLTKPDKTAESTRTQQFGFGCYAHRGFPMLALKGVWRSAARGKDKSLRAALDGASRSARYVRLAAIGDPSGVDRQTLQDHEAEIRSNGLGVLSYTHMWDKTGKHNDGKGAHLRYRAMASCDTWDGARDAVYQGWRATLYVPSLDEYGEQGTKDGVRYTLCPAQRAKPRQCNECGLCDASKDAVDVVLFKRH